MHCGHGTVSQGACSGPSPAPPSPAPSSTAITTLVWYPSNKVDASNGFKWQTAGLEISKAVIWLPYYGQLGPGFNMWGANQCYPMNSAGSPAGGMDPLGFVRSYYESITAANPATKTIEVWLVPLDVSNWAAGQPSKQTLDDYIQRLAGCLASDPTAAKVSIRGLACDHEGTGLVCGTSTALFQYAGTGGPWSRGMINDNIRCGDLQYVDGINTEFSSFQQIWSVSRAVLSGFERRQRWTTYTLF